MLGVSPLGAVGVWSEIGEILYGRFFIFKNMGPVFPLTTKWRLGVNPPSKTIIPNGITPTT